VIDRPWDIDAWADVGSFSSRRPILRANKDKIPVVRLLCGILREECSPSIVPGRTVQAEGHITRLILISRLDIDSAVAARVCWGFHILPPLDMLNSQYLCKVVFIVLSMADITDRHSTFDTYKGC
jgi:hypothetical protein